MGKVLGSFYGAKEASFFWDFEGIVQWYLKSHKPPSN
jgi:hypothetical protein